MTTVTAEAAAVDPEGRGLEASFAARRPVLFLAAHAALGIAADLSSMISTGHSLVTCAVAGWIVLRTSNAGRAAEAIGYVAMADVFWRSAEANFFYEGSKYVAMALTIVALARLAGSPRRVAGPVLYLAAFLPGVIVVMLAQGVLGSRFAVSANLSGPLLLASSMLLFAQLRSTIGAVRSVLWTMLGPITALFVIAARSTISNEEIDFEAASNFVTSGGFGPNQVSALLGLGCLICLLLAITESRHRRVGMEAMVAISFAAQAALTLSRGGLIAPAIAAVGGCLALARGAQSRVRLIAGGGVVAILSAVFIVPNLDAFTGGVLTDRFADVTTNRTELASRELEVFSDNVIFGVGVGAADLRRSSGTESVAAHTEFTRLVAEQGVFGIAALVALGAMALNVVRRAVPGSPRAMTAALVLWSLASMGHSAMRIAAIPFAFGLAALGPGLIAPASQRRSGGRQKRMR